MELTYFIREAKNEGLIKIGKSYDPLMRLKHLSTGNSAKLVLVKTSNENERDLHEKFKLERVNGEWFYPSERLLAHIYGTNFSEVQARVSDKLKILSYLNAHFKASTSYITRILFKRNRTKYIQAAIMDLEAEGKISRIVTKPKTGRPAIYWTLKENSK